MIKAVVGANWGDEGKGKITDMLAQEAVLTLYFWGFTLIVFVLGTRLFKKLQVHFADVL